MCAVPNMAVFCSFFTSCFPGMLLTYFLNDFEIVPVATIITGITFVFTFHVRCIYYYYYYYITFILFPFRGHTGYSNFELHILTTPLQNLFTVFFFANRLQSLLRFGFSRICLLPGLENSDPCSEHFAPY